MVILKSMVIFSSTRCAQGLDEKFLEQWHQVRPRKGEWGVLLGSWKRSRTSSKHVPRFSLVCEVWV